MGLSKPRTTAVLHLATSGDKAAIHELFGALASELRAMAEMHMRAERPAHTLQPSALVNEAFLRMVDETTISPADRTTFLIHAGRAMREVLIDHAKRKLADKRGGQWIQLPISQVGLSGPDVPFQPEDFLALNEAITKLNNESPELADIVDLYFFAGLTQEMVAEALSVTRKSVRDDLTLAENLLRAWMGGRDR